MTQKQESPAVQGGAFGCLARRLDTSKDNKTHDKTQLSRSAFQLGGDECVADRKPRDGWNVRVMACPDGADWNDIASEVAA